MIAFLLDAFRQGVLGKPPDPYETRCNIYGATGVFPIRTIHGFYVQYRLSILFERVDWKEFKKHKMLEHEAQQELLRMVAERVVNRVMRHRFLFTFGTPAMDSVTVVQFQRTPPAIFVDPNSIALLDVLKREHYTKQGCRVEITRVEPGLWDENLIKENIAMLNAEDRNMVESVSRYTRLHEVMAVTVIERLHEKAKALASLQTEQRHQGDALSIATKSVGHLVEIEWELTASSSGRKRTLYGFRSEHGFPSPTDRESVGGACIVTSTRSGKTGQHLEPGREYFFMFLVVDVVESELPSRGIRDTIGLTTPGYEVNEQIVDTITFTLAVPSLAAIEGIQKKLKEWMEKPQQSPVETKAEHQKRKLEDLALDIRFRHHLDQLEREMLSEIDSDDTTSDEKEELKKRVREKMYQFRSEEGI